MLMIALNYVALYGRIDDEPRMIDRTEGTPYWRARLVFEGIPGKDVIGMDILVFDKLADIAKSYASRGKAVAIEGRIMRELWYDVDGQEHETYVIHASRLQLC